MFRHPLPLRLGGILGFLAVALGAFGAHALRDHLATIPKGAEHWDLASRYALVHAAALVAVAAAASRRDSRRLRLAVLAWFFGSLVFSGTLAALALGAPRWFGAITPLGGLALLAGWLLVAASPSREE